MLNAKNLQKLERNEVSVLSYVYNICMQKLASKKMWHARENTAMGM